MRKHTIKRKSLRQPLPPALAPLKQYPNWVTWRRSQGGAKLPCQVDGELAKVNDPRTWSTFAECARVSDQVGIVLLDIPIAAIDLDHCRDPVTGVVEEWAEQICDRARTYCEISPSGTGLHIFGYGEGPSVHTHVKMGRRGKIELYRNCPRFLTVTGREANDCARLRNIDRVIDGFASKASNGQQRVHIEESDEDWRTLCRRYGVSRSMMGPVAVGWRSDVAWKIAQTMRKKGASPGEVMVVLREARCWRDKHGDNAENALRREVERVFQKRE